MDVQTAAPGPALPLGIAVAVGVLVLALAAALVMTRRRPARSAAPASRPAEAGEFPDDDLLAFREHPPGFPGAPPVPSAAGPRAGAPSIAAEGNPVRTLTALALAALALIAVAALVAAVGRIAATDRAPEPARPTGTASASPAPATSVPVMSVPAAPRPGQPGAGELAARSLPLGADGVAARLTFGGVVLEQRAVGITATYPSLSVTVADEGTALAHVRLPTWNCMVERPPADPAAAGCRESVPEYADLPAPALAVTRSGDELRLSGWFPTYTRPNGTAPLYTGRVYRLEVTVEAGGALSGEWTEASGELFLGDGRAASVDDAGVSAMRAGS